MLILSGYGADTSKNIPTGKVGQMAIVKATPKRTTVVVPEKPGFFSTLLSKTAEGVASSMTGQPSQAPQYSPQYSEDTTGKIFGINQYYVYAGAGIGILALLLILKKVRSKKMSQEMVNYPIQPIQIPSKL